MVFIPSFTTTHAITSTNNMVALKTNLQIPGDSPNLTKLFHDILQDSSVFYNKHTCKIISYLATTLEVLHNSCNIGTCGLPEMSPLCPLACYPLALGARFRKTTCAHVTTIKYMYT